ncbi:hypothetical protein HYH03_015219 [Edaphochlamys debaryana]|uniref:Uncharacterized protein n=1 Tax=Edaphochlamys debaryana TaxID=47281 RepID=A0A835XUG6_9CHLO|nr:hypothetical protein HYH03_015219 [Edaphochlamys debaryana]|eukprot:KAG2486124.1 hypothetical protein HYH03_015219 [Edaphochlamys debaryana]
MTFAQRLRKKSSGWSWHRLKEVKVMGLDPSPELVAISMVYFVQGILGLSRLAVAFFFKDELHIEPAEVAVLTGLSTIPWMIKPLYGFISDSVPLLGYRRRSYLVLCGLIGFTAWMTLSYGVHGVKGAVACMILASLGTAASDVVVDSIVVERTRGHPQSVAGSLQSLCWASAAVGGITSAYFSGSLVQDYGCRFVFFLTAFFPLVVSASALLINERPVGYRALPAAEAAGLLSEGSDPLDPSVSPLVASLLPPAASAAAAGAAAPAAPSLDRAPGSPLAGSVWTRLVIQMRALWSAVSRKDILLPAAFVFIWQATPSADSAMFYYQTNVLHFTPEFLGRVKLAGALASLAGVALFNTWLKTVPLRRMLVGLMLLGTALGSTQLILVSGLHRQYGISDQVFVLGDTVILTVLGQISWMPILVLAARVCPEGVEATLFATLMSVLNCGSITGGALGAGLTKLYGVTSENYDNLFWLVLTCNLLTLSPFPFLGMLPHQVDASRGEGEAGEGADEERGGSAGGAGGGSGTGGSTHNVELSRSGHGHGQGGLEGLHGLVHGHGKDGGDEGAALLDGEAGAHGHGHPHGSSRHDKQG